MKDEIIGIVIQGGKLIDNKKCTSSRESDHLLVLIKGELVDLKTLDYVVESTKFLAVYKNKLKVFRPLNLKIAPKNRYFRLDQSFRLDILAASLYR